MQYFKWDKWYISKINSLKQYKRLFFNVYFWSLSVYIFWWYLNATISLPFWSLLPVLFNEFRYTFSRWPISRRLFLKKSSYLFSTTTAYDSDENERLNAIFSPLRERDLQYAYSALAPFVWAGRRRSVKSRFLFLRKYPFWKFSVVPLADWLPPCVCIESRFLR